MQERRPDGESEDARRETLFLIVGFCTGLTLGLAALLSSEKPDK